MKPAGKKDRTNRQQSPDDRAVAQAKAAIEAARFAEAEELARGVLTRRPNHRGAAHALGVVLLAQGNPAEAITLLKTAVRDSNDPVIETHLAMALRQAGHVVEARQWLERAVTREPPFAAAFHELGTLLDHLKHFEEAETVLRRGLKIRPGAPETWCALGGVLLMRGDRDGAERAFVRALVERPGDPGALFGQACVWRDNADFVRAADGFRQALRQIPDWADAKLQLGYCLLELGQWDDAIGLLRAAARLNAAAYEKARNILVRSARGRFWLRPSVLTEVLGPQPRA